jgi:hypothetical protein
MSQINRATKGADIVTTALRSPSVLMTTPTRVSLVKCRHLPAALRPRWAQYLPNSTVVAASLTTALLVVPRPTYLVSWVTVDSEETLCRRSISLLSCPRSRPPTWASRNSRETRGKSTSARLALEVSIIYLSLPMPPSLTPPFSLRSCLQSQDTHGYPRP